MKSMLPLTLHSIPEGLVPTNPRLGRQLTAFLRHGKSRIPTNGIPHFNHIAYQLDKLCSTFGSTPDEVFHVVRNCPKQRLSILKDPSGTLWIAANQGHSGEERIKAAEELMHQLEPSQVPKYLFHGTKTSSVDKILSTGLSKMLRHHVHMIGPDASGINPNSEAKSGFRKDSNAIIRIDTKEAIKMGCVFFQSINGVYLTAGIDGIIPKECLSPM